MTTIKSSIFYTDKMKELQRDYEYFFRSEDFNTRIKAPEKFAEKLQEKGLARLNYDDREAFYYSHYHGSFVYCGFLSPHGTLFSVLVCRMKDCIMQELYCLSEDAEHREIIEREGVVDQANQENEFS